MICLIDEKGHNMKNREIIKVRRLSALILAVMMIIGMMPMTGLTKAYADSSYPNCTIWLGGGITEGTPIKYGTAAMTVRSTQRTYTSSRDTRVSVDVAWFSYLDIKLTLDAHHDLRKIEGICPEIVHKAGIGRDLIRVYIHDIGNNRDKLFVFHMVTSSKN